MKVVLIHEMLELALPFLYIFGILTVKLLRLEVGA